MKKRLFTALTALFLVITCLLTSCGDGIGLSDKNDETTKSLKPDYTEDPSDTNATGTTGSNSNDDPPKTGENSVTQTMELFTKYPNVQKIDSFHNGLAAFKVTKDGYFYFGYIDTEGKVVIEPNYRQQYYQLPTFPYNYLRVNIYNDNNQQTSCIIDRQCNIKFEVGKNGISSLSQPANGYFYVQTVEEKLNGNEYTTTYYSALTGNKLCSFENSRYASDVNEKGEFSVGVEETQYNIKDYDSSFVPENDIPWEIDIQNDINQFWNLYVNKKISGNNNTKGKLAAVSLKNYDGNIFYTVVDSQGNVLFEPQRKIEFDYNDMENFEFCKDLCPAKDSESGLWGYIDPMGNWKIEPKYGSVTPFSADGYATVDFLTVIDTTGKEIISPNKYEVDGKTVLENTYRYTGEMMFSATYTLQFFKDGTVTTKETSQYVTFTGSGTYEINGNTIIFSSISVPGGSGYNSFIINGDLIYINGVEWKLLSKQ